MGDLMSTEVSHCNDFMHISPLNGQRFSRDQEHEFLAQCPPLFPAESQGHTAWLCYTLLGKGSMFFLSLASLAVHTSTPIHTHMHVIIHITQAHMPTDMLTHAYTAMHNTHTYIHTHLPARTHTHSSDGQSFGGMLTLRNR